MPVLDKLYYAEKGKGAFCNGKRIKVNSISNLRKSLFLYDVKLRSNTNKKIRFLKTIAKQAWRLRMYGAAIYNLVSVANGTAAFAIDFDSHSWDHSAGFLLIEEAGGKVTGLNGKKWTPETKDYVASNGRVHDNVLKVLKK
jgi:myo-inositol-1(or 4)-monophosphatase